MFWFLICLAGCLQAKSVFLGPPLRELLFYDHTVEPKEATMAYYRLKAAIKEAGYLVKECSDWDGDFNDAIAMISFNDNPYHGPFSSFPQEKRIHFLFESMMVCPEFYTQERMKPYGRIFVMYDHLVDGKKVFPFYYPQPRLAMLDDIPSFQEKKLFTMVASNRYGISHPSSLYNQRRFITHFFLKNKIIWEFDLFGSGWEGNCNARGTIENKWEVIKQYKFCFCYENMTYQKGYITEKIFDCFVAGCVPIYWGATDITEHIPKECFIDRRLFSSNEDLYHFLKHMDQNSYEEIIVSIRNYLASAQAKLFSIDQFISTVLHEIYQLDH